MWDSDTVEHLVVDSSGFIHNGPIKNIGKNIYTCKEIVDEIKDKQTLERLQFLPYELKLLQFDKENLDQVVAFAKLTGDYKQLSLTDLKLIATVLGLEKRYNGDKFIRIEPKTVVVESSKPKLVDDGLVDQLQATLESTALTSQNHSENAMVVDEEDVEEEVVDDKKFNALDSEWITLENIADVKNRMANDKGRNATTDANMIGRVRVACMTADFSIQNCLLQMGLLAISPKDGLMIKEAKKIALRCHACYKVLYDLTKLKGDFCPKCGNLDTLKRVTYSIDGNGAKKVIINFKKPIRVKGTNKQLPAPRGGKRANNPILAPDQKQRKDKQDKIIVQEKKTLSASFVLDDPGYLVRSNPFARRFV